MIKNITATELKTKLSNNENIELIDCREQDEWNQGYIEGAKLMPMSIFPQEMINLNDKNSEIIVQCRSGHRSMNVCQYLESQGFSNLSNLEGGIISWAQHQFPIMQD